eukprot:6393319-Prymnesium_polylepis.1
MSSVGHRCEDQRENDRMSTTEKLAQNQPQGSPRVCVCVCYGSTGRRARTGHACGEAQPGDAWILGYFSDTSLV